MKLKRIFECGGTYIHIQHTPIELFPSPSLPFLHPLLFHRPPSSSPTPCPSPSSRTDTEFGQRVHTINDDVPRLGLAFLARRVDVCVHAVDGDDVFGPGVPFLLGARACGGGVFEPMAGNGLELEEFRMVLG